MNNKKRLLVVLALLVVLIGANSRRALAQTSITIGPDTLPTAAYNTSYSQQLNASGGTGPYTFSLTSGTLPTGITLSSAGLLAGFADNFANPTIVGTYPITIQVKDANGATASHSYDFVLDKGTPTVVPQMLSILSWNQTFDLFAEVRMPNPQGYYNLSGTVAFSIDGTPVPGCQAVPYNSIYQCLNVSMNLAVGTHTLKVDYTPTGGLENYYYPASGSSQFSVQTAYYSFIVYLFNDANQNGVQDYPPESDLLVSGWTVNLDLNCDKSVDQTGTISWGGYQFSNIPSSGQNNCITVIAEPGYQQTTQLEPFILQNNSSSIGVGFYHPTIRLSPDQLSDANVGAEYYQAFSASGGTGPYTYSLYESQIPDGLTLSTEGVLSGTPTTGGSYSFIVQAEDANHAIGSMYYNLLIKTDGVFTFTSSANPARLGEEVTFTVSATGDVVDSYFGPIPPVGIVTFSADGTPMKGCSNLYLNLDQYWTPGNYPVTCTTAGLTEGAHAITVAFTASYGAYNDTTLSLQQVIKLPDTTPPEVSVTGVAEGATYPRGNVPTPGCSTTDTDSGVATEASLSVSGGDTQGLGSFTATCSGAVDVAGNAAGPVSVQYTVIASADLSISETGTQDPVKPGAKLEYTLEVSNAGPDPAQSLSLQNELDIDTTFDSLVAPQGWTCTYSNGKVSCTSAGLASGSSVVIKITVVINKDAQVGKELVNHVSVESTTFDPDTLNNNVIQKTFLPKLKIFLPVVHS